MGSRCSVDLAADSGEWARLLSRDERPHMTQSWVRGEAKEAVAGWLPASSSTRGGDPVAMCQLLDKSLGSLRWASRLQPRAALP